MTGICECGCGKPTSFSTKARPERGYAIGGPLRFIKGHYKRSAAKKPVRKVPARGWTDSQGHKYVKQNGKSKAVHTLLVERLLKMKLPAGAQVHHVNGNPADNRPANLVVCENFAYHRLLHQRARALAACGHADWRKCVFCKQYDSPENLDIKFKRATWHRACRIQYRRGHERVNS